MNEFNQTRIIGNMHFLLENMYLRVKWIDFLSHACSKLLAG